MKPKPSRNNIMLALTALSAGILLAAGALAADAGTAGSSTTGGSAASSQPPVFARVGKTVINQREFDAAMATASRNRFYHGQPPEGEVAALQREIGDTLINKVLVLDEAMRRKLKPDPEVVRQKLEQHEQRFAGNVDWPKVRDKVMPVLTRQAEEYDLRNQLEQRVRKVPAPNDKQLRKYYAAHPDKFTEPEQLRVSVILLKVDPSSPPGAWEAARTKAEDLVKQLRGGADFAEFAALHSGDIETSDQGGDMGYMHGGMLSEPVQLAVDQLKPGEISEPVGTMEGVAILKLADRKEAKLNSFETVKQRASELYLADESERAWKSLLAKLRKKTPVEVDESRYLPLPKTEAAVETPAAEPAAKAVGEPGAE